jgi:tripeptidyl-peptidase-1
MDSRVPLFHRRYGAHLSKEQVAELVAPHPHALELVTSWLDYYGVPSSSISMTHGGGWLTATDVPMSQANELLGASYQLYRHARTNDTTILRTISYGLPAMLHKHVETVVPTTCFASVRTLRKTPRRRSVEVRQSATSAESGSGVGSAIVGSGSPGVGSTGSSNGCGGDKARRKVMALSRHDHMDMPASLHWLYNYVPTPDQTTLGVASYLDEYPSQADLRMYMNYREDAVAATVRIDGGEYDSSHPDLDAETDNEIDYTEAMAYLTSHVYYSTGGLMRWSPSSNEPGVGDLFLDWLNYILSQTTIPQTISVSYGLLETDLPLEYTTSVCNLFAQLGARGISVLFSSGDNGIGAGDRKDSSGTMRFIPEFPATCTFAFFVTHFKHKSLIAFPMVSHCRSLCH